MAARRDHTSLMIFDILTIFPDLLISPLNESIIKRARQEKKIRINITNIRDYACDKHQMTDDRPFGGGEGMVMKPEPIFAAVENILGSPPDCPVILLTPQGRLFTQEIAWELSQYSHIGLLAGRYEGVDERVRKHLVSDEISVGDYVLTGGELPALVVLDAVIRLLPGVLGDPMAPLKDSHASGLLEYPHYTRPATFRGWTVPEILRSGNHAEIARWRRAQALKRTWQRRPDLLEGAKLTAEDKEFLINLNKIKDEDKDDRGA